MSLDEAKDEDIEVMIDDHKFIVEDIITETFDAFTVDFSDNWLRRGFSVYPTGAAASSC